jgi:Flp pilus assembly protein TadB
MVSEYYENQNMMTLQTLVFALSGAVAMTYVARVALGRREQRLLKGLTSVQAGNFRLAREFLPHQDTSDVPRVTPDVQVTAAESVASSNDALRVSLFRAGIFSVDGQRRYRIWSTVSPVAGGCFFLALSCVLGIERCWPLVPLGILVGYQVPRSYLQRRIRRRDDEILFYLPLVIEQVVLGVSSSLDVGPCMKWIVDIADERDSHNPVTELLALAQQHMKLGVAIDEALCEVGKVSGHTELKHVFMSLAYVVRHGGEVTKQLQELANAVASQREVKIEAEIKGLEIKATGPVGMIFATFMGMFLMSLGIQMLSSFK